MRKRLFLPFVVVLVLLIGVSIVAAQGGLPGAGWKSGQQIQNTSTASDATIVLTAYKQDGTSAPCGSEVVGPGASITFLTDVHCTVDAGFVGSAVVSADQPIAAIVNVNNKGTGAAAGQYRGTDGGDVSSPIVFPLVKNDHKGRTTTFYVQNASDSLNTITAVFNVNGVEYQKLFTDVPANAMIVINPSDTDSPGPVPSGDGNVGSLTITGTQALAGSSLEHETSVAVAGNLQASKAFTPSDYDDNVYCPLVRNAHTGKNQTTGVQVMNVSGGDETFEITYSVGGVAVGPFSSGVVADGESYTFPSTAHLNSGELGSATISSVGGGDIVAVVNDKGVNTINPQRVTTYACFPADSATTSINLPLVKEHKGVNTTGVQVQNVAGDGSTATITMTYTTTGGDTVVLRNTDPVADGSSVTFVNVSDNPAAISVISGSLATLDSTISGVVATSDQPIVAIVNESSISSPVQDTKNYEGFNQP